MSDVVINGFFLVAALIIAGMLVLLGVSIYQDAHAEHFSLRVDSWECAKTHEETYMMMSGKILFPQHRDVCDQWNRKQ